VQLLSGALIAVTRPLLPSHSPFCRHTALIAVTWPLLPSCGLCRRRGASATLSHCNPISWPAHQLGCSYSLRLLPPSCGPCHPHAAPAALMRHLPPSCGPCRPHATPASLMRHLRRRGASATLSLAVRWLHSSSCSPCRPHVAPAALMRPLLPSCLSSRSLAARRFLTGPLPLLLQPRPQLPG
jgi:hypothetical protein